MRRAHNLGQRILSDEEVLRRLHRQEIGGGAAVVTIAAANSLRRDLADYQCPGTDDQLVLAQALNDGFTHYLLLPGDFYFTDAPWYYMPETAPWVPTDEVWWSVRGHGRASVIHTIGTDTRAFSPTYNGTTGAEIRDLAFSSEADGGTIIEQLSGLDNGDRVLLKDLYFSMPAGADPCFAAVGGFGGITYENIVFGAWHGGSSTNGLLLGTDDVAKSVFAGNSFDGDVVIGSGADRPQILNAVIRDASCNTAALWFGTSADPLVQGCTITGTVGGVDLYADPVDTPDIRLVGNLIGTVGP